jgi:hypothetical protein
MMLSYIVVVFAPAGCIGALTFDIPGGRFSFFDISQTVDSNENKQTREKLKHKAERILIEIWGEDVPRKEKDIQGIIKILQEK